MPADVPFPYAVAVEVGSLLGYRMRERTRVDGARYSDEAWRVALRLDEISREGVAAPSVVGLQPDIIERVNEPEVDVIAAAAIRGCRPQAIRKRLKKGTLKGRQEPSGSHKWWIPVSELAS